MITQQYHRASSHTTVSFARIIRHIPYLIAPCPVIAVCRDKKENSGFYV
ncbi:MAG: hypothetical protein WCF46_13015 [Nitrososphaeraceae archaeon]